LLSFRSHLSSPFVLLHRGRSPLHESARLGDADTVYFMLTAGGDLNAKEMVSYAPLGVVATFHLYKLGVVATSRGLLFFFFGINQNGATPLDLAVGETCRAKLKIRANSFASCVTRPDSIMRRAVDSCAACAHDGSSADAVAQSPLDRKIARSFL
jgi:ankyrin repeat protein